MRVLTDFTDPAPQGGSRRALLALALDPALARNCRQELTGASGTYWDQKTVRLCTATYGYVRLCTALSAQKHCEQFRPIPSYSDLLFHFDVERWMSDVRCSILCRLALFLFGAIDPSILFSFHQRRNVLSCTRSWTICLRVESPD